MKLDNGDYWVPEGFQDEIVEDIFTGIPEIMVVIPEANGKTSLLGGVNLYFADFKPTANCLVAAASREQAEILFSQAAGLVYRSPGFDRRFRVFEGYRRIVSFRTRGKIQVKAADDRTGDGAIFDLATIDEPHRARDMSLWRTWRGKVDKRGGQILGISTAGEPGSEFETTREAMHEAASESVTVGRHTRSASPDALIHDWRLGQGDALGDMELVKLANPLSSITPETLARKRRSPSMLESHWARFVCGRPMMSIDSAITAEEWDGQPEGDIPEGEPVKVGMDVAWKWDTFVLAPFWLEDPTRRVFGRAEILVPPRNGIDSLSFEAEVKPAFHRIHDRNPIAELAYDPNAEANVVVEWAAEEFGCELVEVSQSNTAQAGVYRTWMEALRMRWIVHPHDPVIRAHVLNAIAKLVNGTHDQYRFTRPNSSRSAAKQDRRVIDFLIAASGVHWSAVAGLDVEPERPFNLAAMRIVRL